MSEPSKNAAVAAAHDRSPMHGPPLKQHTLSELVGLISNQFLVFSGAQLTLWKLKLLRIAALVLLAVPMALAFLAISFYGFILLDKAADAGLRLLQYPEWFSPLVRGACYIFPVLIGMMIFWSRCIGSATDTTKPLPANLKK